MIQHKQAALSVLDSIRANPALTKAQGEALVEAVFPGNGSKYLGWYINWWYKYATIDNDTFASLRNRVTAMSVEYYGVVNGKMAKLVAERAVNRLAKELNESTLAILDAEILLHQPKAEPDATTLEFFNANGPEANILRGLEAHKMRAEQMIAEYED